MAGLGWGMKTPITLSLVFLCAAASVCAEDWPHWRGLTFNGISTEKNWNADWSAEAPRQAWTVRVGKGYSSFAVANGRVYTQGNTSNQDSMFCFDADSGRQLWKHTYAEPLAPRSYQGGTSATPVVDGPNVYTVAKSGLVHCLNATTGAVVWKKNVIAITGAKLPSWGIAGSPLIIGNGLFLNAGSMGTALDKRTGRLLWKSRGIATAGYSTPVPYRAGNTTALAFFSQKAAIGVNATTGTLLWQFPWKTSYDINAADLVVNGQDIFVSSGYGTGCALLRLTASSPRKIWQNKNLRAQFNSPVLIGGHLYGIDDNARRFTLKCVEWATGREKWRGDNISALMASDGKLICQGETGKLYLVAADSTRYRKLAETRVFREPSWTTPVLANGRIYCRGAAGTVVCLDVRAN